MGEDPPSTESVVEDPPSAESGGGELGARGDQFGGYGISIDEWFSTRNLERKKVVESELTTGGSTIEFEPMSSLSTRTSGISEAAPLKRKAKHQDGGDDENDSEKSVRRRENAHEEYGNNSFDEESEKIRDTQERAHLEKDMKETSILWSPYRSSTMENQNMGSLSEQLDRGSQAVDKNDTSDLRAVCKEIADKVDSWEEYRSPEYNPDSESEVENHNPFPWLAPDSPATIQRKNEKAQRKHMASASNALGYYHTNHPGDDYTPVHVNLEHIICFVDINGYYTHMNFTARNTKDGSEKIFFAELFLHYEGSGDWVVTACDIVGPGALGGLKNVPCTAEIRLVGDTIDTTDVQNCYACDDSIKHIDGAMYKAGHGGPLDYF